LVAEPYSKLRLNQLLEVFSEIPHKVALIVYLVNQVVILKAYLLILSLFLVVLRRRLRKNRSQQLKRNLRVVYSQTILEAYSLVLLKIKQVIQVIML